MSSLHMTLIHESDVCDPRSFPHDFYDGNVKNLRIIHFLRYALQNIHFYNFFSGGTQGIPQGTGRDVLDAGKKNRSCTLF